MATLNKVQLPNGNEYNLTDYRIGSTAVGNASTPVYWDGAKFAATTSISGGLEIGTTADTAAAGNHTHSEYVPVTRKVNNKALSSDINLDASDVNAIPLPTEGTNGQVLTTDGNGNYTWANAAGGDDTKVTQTVSTTEGALPALIAKGTATATDTAYFCANVTINPGNGQMNATQFALNGKKIIVTETSSGGWLWS